MLLSVVAVASILSAQVVQQPLSDADIPPELAFPLSGPVPRNVRPLVRLTVDFTYDETWTMVVEDVESPVSDVAIPSGTGFFARLEPELLPSNTSVSFENGGFSFSLSVGDVVDETAPAGFEGDISQVRASSHQYPFNPPGFLRFSACLPSLNDEPVVVELRGPELDSPVTVTQDRDECGEVEGHGITLTLDGAHNREACFDAVAIDAAGLRSPPYAFCTDLEDNNLTGFGCSSGSGPTTPLALGALLLLLRRRRRARLNW